MTASRPAATLVVVRGGAVVATWDIEVDGCPGLALVDELARLQLAARRFGCGLRLERASRDLCELLRLVGLVDVLAGGGSVVEVGGQTEGGEESRVEEVVVADDPPV